MPLAEQVEAQIEVAIVMPEPDPAERAARRVHGAEEGGDVDVAAGLPFAVIEDAIQLRRDLALWPLRSGILGILDDRLVEPWRRRLIQRHIDVAQVQAEEAVPDLVHPRVMRPAEPPKPIAALGDQRLPSGQLELGPRLSTSLLLTQEVARLRQAFPGHVVLLVADPGVEAGIDPGSGLDPGQRARRWKLAQEF